MIKFRYIIALLFCSIALRLVTMPRSNIPGHLTGQPIIFTPNLIDPEIAGELRALVKSLGSDSIGIPSIMNSEFESKVVVT